MFSDNLGFGEIGAYGGGVLFFSGRTLLAAKWCRFKIFMTGDDPKARDRSWQRLWAPRIFNVEQEGLILPGGE